MSSGGEDMAFNMSEERIPLALAAAFNWETKVCELIEVGADPNELHPVFGHAVHAAAHQGHDNIIRLLLSKGAHIAVIYDQTIKPLQTFDRNPWDTGAAKDITPLDLAAIQGHLPALSVMMEQKESWGLYPNFWIEHALKRAIRSQQIEAMKLLFSHFMLDKLDDTGHISIHSKLRGLLLTAVCVGNDYIVRFFLDIIGRHESLSCSLELCAICDIASHVMIYGAGVGSDAALKAFIDFGFHADHKSRHYEGLSTPIDRAIQRNKLSTVELLYHHGADLNQWWTRNFFRPVYHYEIPLFEFLLQTAPPPPRSVKIRRLLQSAVKDGYTSLVRSILATDIYPNGIPRHEWGILTRIAKENGHGEIESLLGGDPKLESLPEQTTLGREISSLLKNSLFKV
jgi:hypothetical protein